ncbi:hypothetical protein EVAR_97739_1 [Eumeta japonica]|uniref:Uncharacterized protein n=1 Tax=Eumeta variegata TaxID=151549 RepID=A0A4C1XAE7_EUMVA|nr:hypothetical protein EVAR_97739_1 [Eumeta japonica]
MNNGFPTLTGRKRAIKSESKRVRLHTARPVLTTRLRCIMHPNSLFLINSNYRLLFRLLGGYCSDYNASANPVRFNALLDSDSTAYEIAAVKIVTKASQWREIGTCGIRKGRGVLNLRITSFAGKSERQFHALYL